MEGVPSYGRCWEPSVFHGVDLLERYVNSYPVRGFHLMTRENHMHAQYDLTAGNEQAQNTWSMYRVLQWPTPEKNAFRTMAERYASHQGRQAAEE
jgi:hypothetical protein